MAALVFNSKAHFIHN